MDMCTCTKLATVVHAASLANPEHCSSGFLLQNVHCKAASTAAGCGQYHQGPTYEGPILSCCSGDGAWHLAGD